MTFKKIFLVMGGVMFLSVNQFAFAVECPSDSDWSHVRGENWKLSDDAKKEGWKFEVEEGDPNKYSELTGVSPDTRLSVSFMDTGHKFNRCTYHLDDSNVIAAINKSGLPNLHPMPKNFSCPHHYCLCSTIASQTAVCSWEWN